MDSETTLPIAKATMILRGERGVGGSFGKLQSMTQARVGNGLVARLPATVTRHSCWVQARGLGVVAGWCMQVSSRTPESYSPSLGLSFLSSLSLATVVMWTRSPHSGVAGTQLKQFGRFPPAISAPGWATAASRPPGVVTPGLFLCASLIARCSSTLPLTVCPIEGGSYFALSRGVDI